MVLEDVASHALSAAGGSVTIGWLAKVLIQNWIKRRELHDITVSGTLKEVVSELKVVAVELGKIGVRLEGLDKLNERTTEHAEKIAILSTRIETARQNINGLGTKMKEHMSSGHR